MAIAAVRLNHAVLFVIDLERSVGFWNNVFDMQAVVREPRANAAFLRLPRSDHHHDLGLFGLGHAAAPKRPGTAGPYPLAWQVDTIDELPKARDILARHGAYTGESSHGATNSLYGADPDGNEFAVLWMQPRKGWGAYEHAASVEPLGLVDELHQWSGVATAGRVVTEAVGSSS